MSSTKFWDMAVRYMLSATLVTSTALIGTWLTRVVAVDIAAGNHSTAILTFLTYVILNTSVCVTVGKLIGSFYKVK